MPLDLFGFSKDDDELNQGVISTIPGLSILNDFISIEEERDLINRVDQEQWLSDLSRKVQHYGYKYDYRSRRIDDTYRIGPLPNWIGPITSRMVEKEVIGVQPDQMIVNNYEPGQGIALHIDCEPCFDDVIISLSLNADIVMDLKKVNNQAKESILLKRRSLLILTGDARYEHLHGIVGRKSDQFNGSKRSRSRRISLTFRKVILTNQ
jgi:alkylated DNA repair dioxygenase AlkB